MVYKNWYTLRIKCLRIGTPRYYFTENKKQSVPDMLRSPIYATAYGLLSFALKRNKNFLHESGDAPLIMKVLKRMKSWIYDFL